MFDTHQEKLPSLAMTLEHFELVVEAFDKAVGEAVEEVVGDLVQPVIERRQKAIETIQ